MSESENSSAPEGVNSMECGPQPLGNLLDELELDHSDLVKASTEQLTHKMVAKGRKGRRLTRNVQTKILNALNAVRGEGKPEYRLADLFTYEGKR